MGVTLQHLSIFLAFLIAVVPLWYPRYSFFVRSASDGIEDLLELSSWKVLDEKKEQRKAKLEPGDRGYREIARTVLRETFVAEEPICIRLEHERFQQDVQFDNTGSKLRGGDQAKLVAEFESGRSVVLIEPARFESERILGLYELKSWLKSYANRRSHYWTTVLAILWATSSAIISSQPPA